MNIETDSDVLVQAARAAERASCAVVALKTGEAACFTEAPAGCDDVSYQRGIIHAAQLIADAIENQ